MSSDLFASVVSYPDPAVPARYNQLFGLDAVKERLEREAQAILRPDLIEEWSKAHHGTRLKALDLIVRRPPLFIFAGDVGTGKTELAMTFGDRLARQWNTRATLYSLSLRARGSGAVGEMTRLISDAFQQLLSSAPKAATGGKKPPAATILVIDEADALAQSREMAQMHHEDRAGVNALIRGIDDIANARLSCLVIMCSNRLGALDPAVLRRAAAIFEFNRPTLDQREHVLATHLEGCGIAPAEIRELASELGETKQRPYGFTYSDLTQRLIPAVILAAVPNDKVTAKLVRQVIATLAPTPPFKAEAA